MYHHHGFGLPWLIVAAIAIVPFWRICKRVGYSPWLSLLTAIPLVNLIFIYYLAFSTWPSQKSAAAGTPGSTPG
ncbi:MAG TPA: hypothetical protein VK676_05075 [Steroidobacteraceae bacterium]|jgi:hypothetical protein|nr:hypothetical protein [Steroidobacteraceae bacterium]